MQPGESLTAIGNRYGVSVSQISRDNNIQNPNLVKPGQVLRITLPDAPTAIPTEQIPATATPQPTATPGDDSSGQSPQPSATPGKVSDPTATPVRPTATPAPVQRTCNPYPGAGEIAYTVRQGDSLSSIAGTYGTTVRVIRNRNCLSSDLLMVGQRIIVPYGSAPSNTPTPSAMPSATPSADSTPRPQATVTPTPTRAHPSATPRPTSTSAPQPTPQPTSTAEASWWDRWRNK